MSDDRLPNRIAIRKLTRESFAPYGEIIDREGAESFPINDGTTTRFHRLAHVELSGTQAQAIVSLFHCQAFSFPVRIESMERHPHGSQAFVAMGKTPWLVVVAPDGNGQPGDPVAFHLADGKPLGVNYRRNVWHHPLIALDHPADFLVVDRLGTESNLEVHAYREPFLVPAP